MANTPPVLKASGTIRQCRFVKISGNFTGAEADANERVIGISYQSSRTAPLNDLAPTSDHAISGDQIQMYGVGDVCLLEYGGTVTAGEYLKSDADGKGVTIASSGTTPQYVGAIALDGGSSGEKRLVQMVIASVSHAA